MEVLKRLFRVKLCWMKARGQCISYWDVCNFQGNGVCFVIVFGVFHIRIFAIFIKKRYWLIKMRCREIILKGAAKQGWKGVDATVPFAPLLFFGFAEWVLCCMGNVVSSAPSLFFGFAKRNLWCIGRMVNATPNGFFGMATRKLCCMGNVVSSAPLLPIGFTKQNLRGIGRMVNATLNGFASVVKQYLRLVTTQHFLSPCAQKTVSVSQLLLHNCPFIFLLLALCASLFPFHSPLFTFLLLYFFTFRRSPLLFYLFTFLLFNSPSF